MEIEQIIKIAKERNELEFLFQITKTIAESDSIGEEYSYCTNYTRELFNNAEKHIEDEEYQLRGFKDKYCSYLEFGAIPIYKLYLRQINKL